MAGRRGFVVWFTGLSGSGKSTLAAMLSGEIRARGVHVELLDGDEVRTHLSKGLGFSKEDRDTNVRRTGFVAKLVARSGACAMTAAISPYKAVRDEQRAAITDFVEVYCRSTVAELAERDPKGLYKKALAGEIKNFTGVDDPYEEPETPEVTVDTTREPKEESLAKILAKLEELGYVPRRHARPPAAAAATPAELVVPHGGELVPRLVQPARADELRAEAKGLVALPLDERAESDVDQLATGAFSPLKGFLNSKEYLRVVKELRLENGLPWPLPVTLAVDAAHVAEVEVGARVALTARDGRAVAVMEVADKWEPDKGLESEKVFGTRDAAHPGVAALLASGAVYVGGPIEVIETCAPPAERSMTPAASREAFEARGWTRVVGYHTRSPIHRSHEHVTKAALEIVDGLFVHPAVAGSADPEEVPADVRMRCYDAVLGRYYPEDRWVLASYAGATRHAGPREAVLHAIVRKNHGCSHFIVGPSHADVVGDDASDDAQRIFDSFSPGELGVTPLCFEQAFWSTTIGGTATEKTAPGDASTRVGMSDAEITEAIARGDLPPPEVTRPEVVAVLVAAVRGT